MRCNDLRLDELLCSHGYAKISIFWLAGFSLHENVFGYMYASYRKRWENLWDRTGRNGYTAFPNLVWSGIVRSGSGSQV